MAADTEETLAIEFKALFKRIRDLGYREGEQAAFGRIINLAQTSLNEAKSPTAGATPPKTEPAEGPTAAQRRDPLRPFS